MDNITVYACKDGRTRAYDKRNKRVVSYPKLLMEQKIGRSLEPLEEVHHLDKNPLNNNISNLELRVKGEHQREHSTKYFDKEVTCAGCGMPFVWTAKRQRDFYRNISRIERPRNQPRGPFCSKSCVGRYGREKQLGRL